jgi:hypothetical protein
MVDPLQQARDVAITLLSGRGAGATICPSEIARKLAAGDHDDAGGWRGKMPMVHAAVDALLAERRIQLSWKGRRLRARSGPYRIGSAGVQGNL